MYKKVNASAHHGFQQSEKRGLETTHCFSQFLHLQQTSKRIQTPHSLFRDFGGRKNLHKSLVRQKSSSLSPSLSLCLSSGNHWDSLWKAVSEDNRSTNQRFWLYSVLSIAKLLGQRSGTARAGWMGKHPNTWRLQVGSSCCGQLQACYGKKC